MPGLKIILVRGGARLRAGAGSNLVQAGCSAPQAWNVTGPSGDFSLSWRIGGFPKGSQALLAVDDGRCTVVALLDSTSTEETLEAVAIKGSKIPVPTDLLPGRTSSSTKAGRSRTDVPSPTVSSTVSSSAMPSGTWTLSSTSNTHISSSQTETSSSWTRTKTSSSVTETASSTSETQSSTSWTETFTPSTSSETVTSTRTPVLFVFSHTAD